jgi:ABC-type nickel/cobalt efflux system permease component RcnA
LDYSCRCREGRRFGFDVFGGIFGSPLTPAHLEVGVSTAIATAVTFQLIAIAIYLLRFGATSYRTYNDFIYTMMSAVLLAWLFGFFAVWKQYRHEKSAT